ncbi:phage major capsid protein [Phytohabitans aurantiacus]|uniref:Phage capsid protein n=1 Tax=Phytohabitans aurantiacus TaxID=3016789 RepID=A0ABQ5R1Y2_9ACTN|nr:phage major capsid protein [Phytohabitans aurantiacus]GLI00313.1 phage capsid protein [Phytohabitans aurantiacus]
MRTIEEILAALQAIVDAADGRSFTDAEVTEYEALEKELENVRKSNELRARNNAYNTPVNGGPAFIPNRQPDTLDAAFNSYLRTGVPNADISGLRVTNEQGEGTSAAGGYTVPPGFRQKLVEVRKAFGGFASVVDTFDTGNGNPIEYPSLDDTANEGDITAENAAVASGADLVFGTVALGAYKYTSAGAGTNLPLRVPVELLQDSAFDIAGLVARALGTRIARKQASHWVTGTGVGQPKGILAASLTADRDLDTDDAPDYEDLVEFQDLLDEEYDPNARWLMRKSTWSVLRLIVDGNGRPIIQSSTEGISGRPERLLLGKPVVIDEAVPAISTSADTHIMAYGDFRESYVIRRVSNLVVVVNPYSRAANGQVEYTAWERADGNVQNRSSYKILRNASAA